MRYRTETMPEHIDARKRIVVNGGCWNDDVRIAVHFDFDQLQITISVPK